MKRTQRELKPGQGRCQGVEKILFSHSSQVAWDVLNDARATGLGGFVAARDRLNLTASYSAWVSRFRGAKGGRGLHAAIGGEFEAFGIVELGILRHYGVQPAHYVIDVGCGAGRLAVPLSAFLTGRYLGTDVVADLIAHARASVSRPDWVFRTVDALKIPERDGVADCVCFFSVMTHLLHEQSYLYLLEAARVLRPGDIAVLSFLEFHMEAHWNVFEATVANERRDGGHPLNVFIERNALSLWASRIGLDVVEFRDGTEAFVPLPAPLTLDNGTIMEGHGNLGQSICVLAKP